MNMELHEYCPWQRVVPVSGDLHKTKRPVETAGIIHVRQRVKAQGPVAGCTCPVDCRPAEQSPDTPGPVDRAHIQPLELADLRGFERPDRDAPECLKVLPGDQESSRGSRILAREVNQLIGEALKREIQIQGAGIFAKEEAQ